jgi:hypothetical protein
MDKYIIQVLKEARLPLTFTEIKLNLSKILNREVGNFVIDSNLKNLILQGTIEKIIENGKIKYRLTQQFFNKQVLSTLSQIIKEAENQPLCFDFFGDSPPYIVIGENLIEEELENPIEVVSQNLIKRFQMLPKEIQEAIRKLLLWSYWGGVQAKISSKEWRESIEKAKEFTVKNVEELQAKYEATHVEDFNQRLKVEKAILRILNLVEELMQKPNLLEFLDFLYYYEDEVKRLQREIYDLTGREFIGGGELLFEEFFDFHRFIIEGLAKAKILLRFDEAYNIYLVNYSKVWNEFFKYILSISRDLPSIKGDLKTALEATYYYKSGFTELTNLTVNCRLIMCHLWGIPDIIKLSNKNVLLCFERWLQALKNGELNYRKYLFSREVESKLSNACEKLKKGKALSDEKIDYAEPWTLRDLYELHPRGRDPEFYNEILEALRKNKQMC